MTALPCAGRGARAEGSGRAGRALTHPAQARRPQQPQDGHQVGQSRGDGNGPRPGWDVKSARRVRISKARHRHSSRHREPGPEQKSGPPRRLLAALTPLTGPKSLHKRLLK